MRYDGADETAWSQQFTDQLRQAGISLVTRLRHRLQDAPRAPAVNNCGTPGCSQHTTEGKPYCIRCLSKLPYVVRLQQGLAERQTEWRYAKMGDWQRINLGGSYCSDILTCLRRRCFTPVQLASLTELTPAVLEVYLTALKAAGYVRVFSKRPYNRAPLGPENLKARRHPARLIVITREGRRFAADLWATR